MDFLHELVPWLPTIDQIVSLGPWLGLAVIIGIVFAETGLLVGFFLPGDSLLVTAGFFASTGHLHLWTLLVFVSLAAVAGDATGYLIGKKAGSSLYARPDSRFFKRQHLLRAHAFYEKHGGKTIILARFVPIVRTFAPTVAGAADMSYRRFAAFNVFGGIGWVLSTVLLGYFLGESLGRERVEKNLHYIIGAVILLSLLPAIVEMVKARREHVQQRKAG